MMKPLFARKPSFLFASTLIFSVLFTAIVYACSGLGPMRMVFQHDSMNGGMVERGPCSEHKQDICKSVRQRMLSIQVSSAQTDTLRVLSTSVEAALQPDVLLASTPSRTVFNPISKISPPFPSVV